jgi:hypothetical protein
MIKIFVCIIIILLLCFSLYFVFNRNNKQENFTDIDSNIDMFINKDIYLKCVKLNENNIPTTYYLSFGSVDFCNIIKNSNDCTTGVAYISDAESKDAFQLLKKSNRYRLISTLNNTVLSQSLNYKNLSTKVCFEPINQIETQPNEIDYFILESFNGKYIIKYEILNDDTGNYEYYYLGLCNNINSICNKPAFQRLCLFKEDSNALLFEIEFVNKIISESEVEVEVESQSYLPLIKQVSEEVVSEEVVSEESNIIINDEEILKANSNKIETFAQFDAGFEPNTIDFIFNMH